MKLICVGVGPCRCLVLRFRKANILLDCSTPLYSTLCTIGNNVSEDRISGEGDGGRDAALASATAAISDTRTTPSGSGFSSSKDVVALGTSVEPGLAERAASKGQPMEPPPTSYGRVHDGGSGNPNNANKYELVDLTPFLPLLLTMELHAALVTSPEALLALPHLLQYGEGGFMSSNDFDDSHHPPPKRPGSGAGGGGANAASMQGSGVASSSDGEPHLPTGAWHHMGPIRGPVYCTQSALDAAEQLAVERLAAEVALAATAAAPSDKTSKLPCSCDLAWEPMSDEQEALLATCWRRRAPWRAVRHCLDRVRPVRYGQVVPLDSYELTAVPYSSGSGFGHAVWQVADGGERCRTVLYLPDASPTHPFAPPLPLELVVAPDALILGPGCLTPSGGPSGQPPRPPMQLVKEAVLRAVVMGGSVLIPVHATGDAWVLLESLAGALASADLAQVPLLYIGLRSGTSLALASVSLEALAPDRQAAVYVPEHPFAFNSLMQTGRMVVASSLQDPAVQRCLAPGAPAVALVAADSLLYPGGPAFELLLRFGPDPRNLLLLPHAAPPAVLRGIQHLYDEATATRAASTALSRMAVANLATAGTAPSPLPPPPPPMRMRMVHVPLRGGTAAAVTGPSPSCILELLSRLQPRHLLATHRDLLLLRQQQQVQLQGSAAVSNNDPSAQQTLGTPPLARESVVPYDWLHQARVALPRNVCSALVSPELLQRLQWMSGGPGLQLARLNCLLVFRDGAWHVEPVPGGSSRVDSVAAAGAMTSGGCVAADQLLLSAEGGPRLGPLLEALAGQGITRVSVESEGEHVRLVVEGTDAELLLRPDGVHLTTNCPVLRLVITDCLMKQLTVV